MKGKLNFNLVVFLVWIRSMIAQAIDGFVVQFWTTYSWARTSWVPNRAASAGMTGKIIDLVIAAVVMAALVPYAIITIIDTNTTGWDATSVALWVILPTLAVLGIFVLFIRLLLGRGGKGI